MTSATEGGGKDGKAQAEGERRLGKAMGMAPLRLKGRSWRGFEQMKKQRM
jgi:hypothetical protein